MEHKEHEVHNHEHHHSHKKENGNKTIIVLALVVIALVAGIIIFNKKGDAGLGSNKALTAEEAKTKALDFIKNNLVASGTKVEAPKVEEYGRDMYKVFIKVEGNPTEIESYISKDGKTFFPQSLDIAKTEEEMKKEQTNNDAKTNETAPVANAPKSDKPKVELFVMSYCPFGTQIEKGIIPVVEALGSKIDFSLKFCDYAMHEKKELDEQVRQYCIQKEQGGKLLSYLKCFLKDGKSDDCVKSNKIDDKKLSACIKATDTKFKVTENYNKKDTWKGNFPPFEIYKAENTKYSIQGSPSLVINGAQVNSSRDSSSLLKTICNSFNKKPGECDKKLSDKQPSAGFGEGEAASSGSNNAGCAN